MSVHGKVNLLSMILMPAVAALASIMMFGPLPDTIITVFGMNIIPMLFGGLFAALLLRGAKKAGGVGMYIALWPSLVPAVIGIVWYLTDALMPAELDPGRVLPHRDQAPFGQPASRPHRDDAAPAARPAPAPRR